jgi:hypothetical protein
MKQKPGRKRRWWRLGWVQAVLAVVLLAGMTVVTVVVYVARHAEPILRKRVVETLAARFHSPVELDGLDISVLNGLQVQGRGLRILYLAGPTQPDKQPNAAPMVSVQQFTFRTTLRGLLRSPTRVETVYVQGLELHIPPGNARSQMFGGPHDKKQPKIALLVSHIQVDGAKIFIETDKPGKDPLEFDIQSVKLTDVGSDQPFLYDALLTNPKPEGQIHATGHFGPWQGAEPRETPVDGDYSFDHADLNSIKGLGGMLSSTGHFAGELGHITIDGTTETPDFSLDISDHPLPLHTTFHAYVDGTTGDTTLDPVNGELGHTTIVARGTVTSVHGKGHDIALDTSVPQGRIEDLLALGMKSWPPVMHGGVTLRAKLHIPPGPVRVAKKIELAGTVNIANVVFTNAKVQEKIDSFSMRAQGKPEESGAAGSDGKAEVQSELMTNFALSHSLMTFPAVDYTIPGVELELHGAYGMENTTYYFMGHVRTKATASQMTTGWKSVLLKPFNKLLEKNGAGLELPIEIHGSGSDVHFGLAMHGADESAQQMGAEVKAQPKPAPQPKKAKK